MKKLLIAALMLLGWDALAQRQNENWIFGEGAGINFEGGIAVPMDGWGMGADEGCATQSDAQGNLLFFTNGMQVYNKNGDWMENGSGLLAHYSSAQTVIVQKPGSDTIYYIFHAASQSIQPLFSGVRYTEVDMSLNNGLGDVTANKNIQILEDGTEQIATTRHRNGIDIWVLCHGVGNAHHAYLVTENGVQPAVVSNVGFDVTDDTEITGMHKISPDGSKIAATLYLEGLFLYDFDNTTGIVSNPVTLNTTGDSWYGVEFSPNSSLLYASRAEGSVLFQYNLATDNIPASEIQLFETTLSNSGALQLAPDGKIYMAQGYRPKISVIANPNAIGQECQFSFHTFDLDNRISAGGLPPVNLFPLPLAITAVSTICKGEILQPAYQSPIDFDSILWDFGDGTTSTAQNPQHIYTTAGTYTITLTGFLPGVERQESVTVMVIGLPDAGLEEVYAICPGETVAVTAPDGLLYEWSTGQDTQSIEIATLGQYSLIISNGECTETYNFEVIAGDCPQEPVAEIPKGISPNGDTLNDFLDLSGNGTLHLSIYNRYGLEVYHKNNYTTQWFGQSNDGSELPVGTYYYVVHRQPGTVSSGWIYINREEN